MTTVGVQLRVISPPTAGQMRERAGTAEAGGMTRMTHRLWSSDTYTNVYFNNDHFNLLHLGVFCYRALVWTYTLWSTLPGALKSHRLASFTQAL